MKKEKITTRKKVKKKRNKIVIVESVVLINTTRTHGERETEREKATGDIKTTVADEDKTNRVIETEKERQEYTDSKRLNAEGTHTQRNNKRITHNRWIVCLIVISASSL